MVIAVVLSFFGEIGQVTAIMVVAVPLTAIRAPGVVMLERQLRYKPLALVDLIETVSFYGLAIALVSIGWGVWGLASASVVRALIGSIVLVSVLPSARLLRPCPGHGYGHSLGSGFNFRLSVWSIGFVTWEPTLLLPFWPVFPRSAYGASRFAFFRFLSSFSARCGGSPFLRCRNSLQRAKTSVRRSNEHWESPPSFPAYPRSTRRRHTRLGTGIAREPMDGRSCSDSSG